MLKLFEEFDPTKNIMKKQIQTFLSTIMENNKLISKMAEMSYTL